MVKRNSMKGWLLILPMFVITAIIITAMAGCTEKNADTNVTAAAASQLTQTLYADQTSGASTIEFTTRGPWTSAVMDGSTKASIAADWLSITPESGELAGDYSVSLALKKNFTGARRTAVVNIHSGGDKLAVTVTQEATTSTGLPPAMKKVSSVTAANWTTVYFTYDPQGRLAEARTVLSDGGAHTASYTYPSATLIEGTFLTYTLDGEGRVTRVVDADTADNNPTTYDYIDGYLSSLTTFHTASGESTREEYHREGGNITSVDYYYDRPGSSQKISSYAYDYSTIRSNMGNMDIPYMLSRGAAADVLLFGYLGKRSEYLPSSITAINADGSRGATSRCRYVQDDEGYVTKIFLTADNTAATSAASTTPATPTGDEPLYTLTYQ